MHIRTSCDSLPLHPDLRHLKAARLVGFLQDNVSSEEKNPSSFANSLTRTTFQLWHYFLLHADIQGRSFRV